MATWLEQTDLTSIFDDEDNSFTVSQIVDIVNYELQVFARADVVLKRLLRELRAVSTFEQFDAVFAKIYDWADVARIWIKTF